MNTAWRLKTWISRCRYRHRQVRQLEIGPGPSRLPGFETLDVVGGRHVDYVADASRRLPFRSETFDLVYASHILEHIPWYLSQAVLIDWVRILKPGGALEVWVPNGLLICRALVDFEDRGLDYIERDGWYKFNPERDPCVWASGRLFTYGDGTGDPCHPNWHRAIFTPRHLCHLLMRAGLAAVVELQRSDVRGHDHGWINLGMMGRKIEL